MINLSKKRGVEKSPKGRFFMINLWRETKIALKGIFYIRTLEGSHLYNKVLEQRSVPTPV
jgi:hypothetical protein